MINEKKIEGEKMEIRSKKTPEIFDTDFQIFHLNSLKNSIFNENTSNINCLPCTCSSKLTIFHIINK